MPLHRIKNPGTREKGGRMGERGTTGRAREGSARARNPAADAVVNSAPPRYHPPRSSNRRGRRIRAAPDVAP
jgi:hypothetical protein